MADIVRLRSDKDMSAGTLETVAMVTDSPLAGMWHCTASKQTTGIKYLLAVVMTAVCNSTQSPSISVLTASFQVDLG